MLLRMMLQAPGHVLASSIHCSAAVIPAAEKSYTPAKMQLLLLLLLLLLHDAVVYPGSVPILLVDAAALRGTPSTTGSNRRHSGTASRRLQPRNTGAKCHDRSRARLLLLLLRQCRRRSVYHVETLQMLVPVRHWNQRFISGRQTVGLALTNG